MSSDKSLHGLMFADDAVVLHAERVGGRKTKEVEMCARGKRNGQSQQDGVHLCK